MAQRISPSVFDKVDTFFIAELFVGKLEELTPQLKIFAETFSVYFFTEVSVGYLLYIYLIFFAYDEFKDSDGGGWHECRLCQEVCADW